MINQDTIIEYISEITSYYLYPTCKSVIAFINDNNIYEFELENDETHFEACIKDECGCTGIYLNMELKLSYTDKEQNKQCHYITIQCPSNTDLNIEEQEYVIEQLFRLLYKYFNENGIDCYEEYDEFWYDLDIKKSVDYYAGYNKDVIEVDFNPIRFYK